MSKTGWIILGVCLCLVLCIAAGLLLARRIANSLFANAGNTNVDSSATKGYKDLSNPYAADGVYTVQMKDLQKLDIDWISGSVTVELTDEDTIRIQETTSKAISEKDALRYGVSGGTLRVQACKKGHIGSLPQKDLKVFLPRALAEGLKECDFDTVSAAILAGNLTLDELEIDTVSGKITLSDIAAEEAKMDTVSGQIELESCAFDSLRIDSVSAYSHVVGTVRKVKISSVSGEIQLHLEDCRELKLNTMSGRIQLGLSRTPKELSIDTTSGTTTIDLPLDASCTIKLDAMSGKLYLNEEAVPSKQLVLGDGAAEFDIDSMSGSVYINTK